MSDERAIAPATGTGITLGQQQLDAGDLILPRIKIVQQMSAEANDSRAKPGDFFNTLTQEDYGQDLDFIPITAFKQRVLLVRKERRERADEALQAEGLEPLSEGDGLKCRSFDMAHGIGEPGIACGECPLARWDGSVPPICTETYNVAALTVVGDLIILSFSKSGAKTGKRLFSMLRLTAGAPWSKVYTATTRQDKNALGTFFVPDVVLKGGETPPPELLRVAHGWAEQLGGVRIDVTPEDEHEGEEVGETKDF